MLTQAEAQELVLGRLTQRQHDGDYFVEEHRTVERPFGWLFFVTASDSRATAQGESDSRRLIIVNKHVQQVIESSITYSPERLIEIYEGLLAKSQASAQDWCLAVSFRLPWKSFARERLAKKAKRLGFYEIK